MAKDIAWAAVNFLQGIEEAADKDFPNDSGAGSDAYLKAIIRSYLGQNDVQDCSYKHSVGQRSIDDSENLVELLGLVHYLDKKVKHLEKTLEQTTGSHDVKTFPGDDDVQEALLRR